MYVARDRNVHSCEIVNIPSRNQSRFNNAFVVHPGTVPELHITRDLCVPALLTLAIIRDKRDLGKGDNVVRDRAFYANYARTRKRIQSLSLFLFSYTTRYNKSARTLLL